MPLPVKLSPVSFTLFNVSGRHYSPLLQVIRFIINPVWINLLWVFPVQGPGHRRFAPVW